MLRWIPLFILLLFLPQRASAQATFIQPCHNYNGSGATSCTLTGMGAHHFIITTAVTYATSCSTSNTLYSDSLGAVPSPATTNVVWQQCLTWSGNFIQFSLICTNTLSNSGTDTFTLSASTINWISVAEYSGLTDNGVSVCATDGSNGANGTQGSSTSPASAGSITTTAAADLLIAATWFSPYPSAATITAPTSYTSRVYFPGSGTDATMTADYQPGATGTYSPTFVLSPPTWGSQGGWTGMQAAFTTGSSSSGQTQIGATLVGP